MNDNITTTMSRDQMGRYSLNVYVNDKAAGKFHVSPSFNPKQRDELQAIVSRVLHKLFN
jgi:hypothetical protein